MAKYHYPSRYWADDKDVSDLFSQAKFGVRKLHQISKHRGIILSAELPKETIVEYLSTLPFSWAELIGFLQEIESEQREPSLTWSEIERDLDIPQIETAIKNVRDLRSGLRKKETYEITTNGDTVNVVVKYQELNHLSTRILQWTDQRVELQLIQTAGKIKVRHGATERGSDIANAFIKELQPPEGPQAPTLAISLENITCHVKRTDFFRKIIFNLEGLRAENVMDVRLNRIQVDEDGTPQVETGVLTLEPEPLMAGVNNGEAVSAPAATVRKTVLSGDSLLQSREFQDFVGKGFYITKAVWTAVENSGAGRKFEFEAEFKNAEQASDFTYKPKSCWERDGSGELARSKAAPKLDDRRILIDKLEEAAKRALAEISDDLETEADTKE